MLASIKDTAHAALAVLGVLLGMQAPIVAYFTSLGAEAKILSAVFGGIGMAVTLGSMLIDSRAYTSFAEVLMTTDYAPKPLPATPATITEVQLP